jgi:hypothetical protein
MRSTFERESPPVSKSYSAHRIRDHDLPACTRLLQFEFREPAASRLCSNLIENLFREDAMYGTIVEELAGKITSVATGVSCFFVD